MRTGIRLLLAATLLTVEAAAQASPHIDAAEAYLQTGQIGRALTEVRDHLESHPEDLAAHELLIDIHLNLGDAKRIQETYGNRLKDGARTADALYLYGRAVTDTETSKVAYLAALELDEGHARSHMGLGAVHRVRGDHGQAAEAFRAAIRLDDSLTEAWNGLWSAEQAAGDSDAARRTARRSIAANPDDATAILALAMLDPVQAKVVLQQGMRKVPDDGRLPAALARLHFEAGNVKAAISVYDQALSLLPHDADLRLERALMEEVKVGIIDLAGASDLLRLRLAAASDPAGALAGFDRLVQDFPRSPWPWVARGNLQIRAQGVEVALADLRRALTLRPDIPEVQRSLGLMLLHRIETADPDGVQVGSGDSDAAEASALLISASEGLPHDISLAIAAGMAKTRLRGFAAGEIHLREVVARFPGETAPPLALARLELASGDADGAYHVLVRALKTSRDPQLALALAATATKANRPGDAAALMDLLAKETGDERFSEAARRLRAATAP